MTLTIRHERRSSIWGLESSRQFFLSPAEKLSSYLWKKGIMFLTWSLSLSVCMGVCVCVCVCVCVIMFVMRWLDLPTWYYVRLLPLTTAQHCNIIKMIPFCIRKIWIIRIKTQNLWTDSHLTWTACSLTRDTTYNLQFLRFIDQSRFYDHFSNHWLAITTQVHRIFFQIVFSLQNLLSNLFWSII